MKRVDKEEWVSGRDKAWPWKCEAGRMKCGKSELFIFFVSKFDEEGNPKPGRGVLIQKWIETKRYTGPSSGIFIPKEDFPDFASIVGHAARHLDEMLSSGEPSEKEKIKREGRK